MKSLRTIFALSLPLLALSVLASESRAQPKTETPEAVLQAFKAAIDSGDAKVIGERTAGDAGATLRILAEPLIKAKVASDKLDKALEAKNIAYKNLFAAGLTPFAENGFELVELTKEKDQTIARIKFGPRGKGQEESVRLKLESGVWRLEAPIELARMLPAKDRAEKKANGLGKLADLLTTVPAEVESGKLTTKEAVALRIVQAFDEGKLADLLR